MKTLFFTLLMTGQITVFAMTTKEASQTIATQATQLGKIAYGVEVHKVKGKSAREMFKQFLAQDTGENFKDIQLVDKEANQIEFGDETDEGFTSMKSAIQLISAPIYELEQFVDDSGLEPADPKLRQKRLQLKLMRTKWAPAILAMIGTGVEFAYDGHGPGYCGVSFVRLFVIDPHSKTIYIINLSEGGQC